MSKKIESTNPMDIMNNPFDPSKHEIVTKDINDYLNMNETVHAYIFTHYRTFFEKFQWHVGNSFNKVHTNDIQTAKKYWNHARDYFVTDLNKKRNRVFQKEFSELKIDRLDELLNDVDKIVTDNDVKEKIIQKLYQLSAENTMQRSHVESLVREFQRTGNTTINFMKNKKVQENDTRT